MVHVLWTEWKLLGHIEDTHTYRPARVSAVRQSVDQN